MSGLPPEGSGGLGRGRPPAPGSRCAEQPPPHQPLFPDTRPRFTGHQLAPTPSALLPGHQRPASQFAKQSLPMDPSSSYQNHLTVCKPSPSTILHPGHQHPASQFAKQSLPVDPSSSYQNHLTVCKPSPSTVLHPWTTAPCFTQFASSLLPEPLILDAGSLLHRFARQSTILVAGIHPGAST